ncbi:MAG: hypothetical protein JW384_04063 [Nitrosomonadaceae bacterium]|nr:hypothetical protein [Nitrosomonadaceae bacterium]
MNGTLSLIGKYGVLALACLQILCPTDSIAQSLKVINDATKGPIEVAAGPKVYMSDQARLTFLAAWKEFRNTHTYTLDGEFEPGSGCPDDQDTLDAFYIHLGSHRLTKTIRFMQRCSLCAGSGKIQTAPEGNIGNNNCPNCRGSGREEAASTYTFYVLPVNLPAKPETPRQKQEKALRASVAKEMAELENLSSSGNISASLKLGKIYAEGYHYIPKDVAKSEPYFFKALILGSIDGLPGYLNSREQAFRGNPNDALLLYALRLASNSPAKTTPKLQLSFTDHLIAQALADRILVLVSKSKLTGDDLNLHSLRKLARTSDLPDPIQNKGTPILNSVIREFLSSDRTPRISGASLNRIRQAAIAKSNGAFGMLADFSHNGEGPSSSRNAQAAHIYYILENLTSGDSYALECAQEIQDSVDTKTTEFFVNQYRHLLYNSTVNETVLIAIDEIHALPGNIK